MTTEEKRYTLAEAQAEMKRQECARHGHSWNIVQLGSGDPIRIVCDSCGWGGSVAMGDKP